MESTSKMLLSLEKLMNHKIGGVKTKNNRKSKQNLKRVTSQSLGINRNPANKLGHNPKIRIITSSVPNLFTNSKKIDDNMDDMLSSFQAISFSIKKKVPVKKASIKRTQRPVKMQEDQSVDDMLASMLNKASTSISQKSRSIAKKNIKNSKSRIEKEERETTRRSKATRSSSRNIKKPENFKPTSKAPKKAPKKARLSAIPE